MGKLDATTDLHVTEKTVGTQSCLFVSQSLGRSLHINIYMYLHMPEHLFVYDCHYIHIHCNLLYVPHIDLKSFICGSVNTYDVECSNI